MNAKAWKSMEFKGNQWEINGTYEHQLKSIEINEINGKACKLMKINENQWKSMEINANQWKSMERHANQ